MNVSFSSDRGERLWPKDLSGILIKKNQYGGSLNVSYYHLSNTRNSERSGSTVLELGSFREAKFVCNFVGATKGDSERELYRWGYLKGSDSMFISNTSTPWKVQVSINGCNENTEIKEIKQATCNLKVTDGNDLEILHQLKNDQWFLEI